MPVEKITKRTIEASGPRESRYVVFDSLVSGFGLRVYPSGQKSWIYEYRPYGAARDSRKKRYTIGDVKDFTADEARKLAEGYRAAVRTGGDPQAVKNAEREAPTLRDIGRAFLEEHVAKKRGASTLAAYANTLENHLLSKHGTTKAKDFSGRDMSRLHQRMESTPYAANKLLAVVSSMYGWANGKGGLLDNVPNPAAGIERFQEEERGSVLSTDELQRLGAAIRQAETVGVSWVLNPDAKSKHRRKDADTQVTVISEHAAAALRLLIFTGARLREILTLRWDQFDEERGLLLLPEHKTKRATGKPKVIVLNAPALAVLNGLTRIGRYVIAGDAAGTKDEKPRADLKRPWDAVRRAAGLPDLRIHDLRHNFGGFGAGGGYGLPLIGSLLGHSPKNPRTTARYAHLAADPLRNAANAIGADIAARMGEVPSKNNVVPLAKGRGPK